MSKASKRKGYGAERELVKLLVKWGIAEARRQPLSGAIPDFPCDLHILGYGPESKRQERCDIWGWWRQTVAAARGGVIPILFFRRNNSEWLVTLRAEDWAALEVELRQLREVAVVAA